MERQQPRSGLLLLSLEVLGYAGAEVLGERKGVVGAVTSESFTTEETEGTERDGLAETIIFYRNVRNARLSYGQGGARIARKEVLFRSTQ